MVAEKPPKKHYLHEIAKNCFLIIKLLPSHLESSDQRHPISSLPLECPVSHESLKELLFLLDADEGGDLLNFLPRTLGREVHQASEQDRNGGVLFFDHGSLFTFLASFLLDNRNTRYHNCTIVFLSVNPIVYL